jgi:hypothetical protein
MLLLWLILLLVLFLLPLGYGWGYRGWGPPYPRLYRRRAAAGGDESLAGWGYRAELLWLVLALLFVWLLVARPAW